MNQSGTYVLEPGVGLVKVSDEIPTLVGAVYVPKGDIPHYDRSALRRFESKADKRAWLKRWGLREAGIIKNADKRWNGHSRNATRPTWKQRQERKQMREWVKAQGGVNGLLNRVQRREGCYV